MKVEVLNGFRLLHALHDFPSKTADLRAAFVIAAAVRAFQS